MNGAALLTEELGKPPEYIKEMQELEGLAAKEVAAELSFPVAYGVTHAQAEQLGAWWEERRGIIQPSEFLLTADGKVRSATYSSGPIGRVDAADVVKLVTFYDKLAAQKT